MNNADDVIFALTFGFGGLVLSTILIMLVVRTWAGNHRARAEIARDDAFRKLAESYVGLLQKSTAANEASATELRELRAKVDGMERLLREVE